MSHPITLQQIIEARIYKTDLNRLLGHEDLDDDATRQSVLGLLKALNSPGYREHAGRYVNLLIATQNTGMIDTVDATVIQLLTDHKDTWYRLTHPISSSD